MRTLGLGGVGVHADDGNGWPHAGQPVQELAQLGFHPLGAGAELLQVGAAAFRTHGRGAHGVAAVVADELGALLVVGERGGAVRTLGHETAVATQKELREAALVQQKHRLAALCELLAQRPGEASGEHGPGTGGELGGHVHHLDGGHGSPLARSGQRRRRPARVLVHLVEGLDGRGGRAEHQRTAGPGHHPFGHVARVVARRGILLVGALVLLVDDDESHVGRRA